MTDPAPGIDEVLEGVARFLREEVAGASDGVVRFRARVAAALVDQVRRDSTRSASAAVAEAERLQALLGDAGNDLDALREALRRRLRVGELRWDDPEVSRHAMAVTRESLSVTNPGWLDPQARR